LADSELAIRMAVAAEMRGWQESCTGRLNKDPNGIDFELSRPDLFSIEKEDLGSPGSVTNENLSLLQPNG